MSNFKQSVNIEPEWNLLLQDYFYLAEWQKTAEFVRSEYLNKKIFPSPKDIFRAFWLTPFSKVKVVILGQDPYHDVGQAHGLCFSVPNGQKIPPSLRNIYKEIEQDLQIKKNFSDGNLQSWAEQGVFLLNAVLTVEAHKPTSHRDKGWELFTDLVIEKISQQKERIVFLLWGNFAKSKKRLIDTNKHLILEAPHPSPFSAHTGFLGCGHFSKTNAYLRKNKETEIFW